MAKATVTGVDGYAWMDADGGLHIAVRGDVIDVSRTELTRIEGALTPGVVEVPSDAEEAAFAAALAAEKAAAEAAAYQAQAEAELAAMQAAKVAEDENAAAEAAKNQK